MSRILAALGTPTLVKMGQIKTAVPLTCKVVKGWLPRPTAAFVEFTVPKEYRSYTRALMVKFPREHRYKDPEGQEKTLHVSKLDHCVFCNTDGHGKVNCYFESAPFQEAFGNLAFVVREPKGKLSFNY
jgi:hypothetical protein